MTESCTFNQKGNTLHGLIHEPMPLVRFLEAAGLTKERGEELASLGAVFCNKVRTFSLDEILTEGHYVRVHLEPKRYDISRVDWESLVVAEDADYLAINKPPGIPVHQTVDNLFENLVAALSLSRSQLLLGTHRIDQLTQGLVIIARTHQAAARIHRWLRNREVRKIYRALVTGNPTVGKLAHYQKQTRFGANEMYREEGPDLSYCELEILAAKAMDNERSEVLIQLITGRTHQIRNQLSFEKWPILGDPLYGGAEFPYLALQACEIELPSGFKATLKSAPWSES